MPIIENVGGVLRTHSAEFENIGGVIREKSSVVVNEGGVLRGIYSSKKAKVEGITPLVEGDGFMVIAKSATFTLTAPAGARIIIAGGGQNGQIDIGADSNGEHDDAGYRHGAGYVNGGSGGFVAEYVLTGDVKNVSCTVTLGAAMPYNKNVNASTLSASSLKIGSVSYTSGSTIQIIQSKWGPVGGNGGKGYYRNSSGGSKPVSTAPDGTGAGGGGGGIRQYETGSSYKYTGYLGNGGNSSGYGNKGGNGSDGEFGQSGASGNGGAPYLLNSGSCWIGGGGGGGYGAGGGGSAAAESVWYDNDEESTVYINSTSFPGAGGAGVLVIEW